MITDVGMLVGVWVVDVRKFGLSRPPHCTHYSSCVLSGKLIERFDRFMDDMDRCFTQSWHVYSHWLIAVSLIFFPTIHQWVSCCFRVAASFLYVSLNLELPVRKISPEKNVCFPITPTCALMMTPLSVVSKKTFTRASHHWASIVGGVHTSRPRKAPSTRTNPHMQGVL